MLDLLRERVVLIFCDVPIDSTSGNTYIGPYNLCLLLRKDFWKKIKQPNDLSILTIADGKDVGKIAKYGPDGKKLWEIHTTPHHDLKDHYHEWKDGQPVGKPKELTNEMKKLLDKVRNYMD